MVVSKRDGFPVGPDIVILMLSRNSQQCEPGSYVQTSAGYPLDVKAEAWSACDIDVPNGSGGCDYGNVTEHRAVAGMNIQNVALGIGGGQIVLSNNPSNE